MVGFTALVTISGVATSGDYGAAIKSALTGDKWHRAVAAYLKKRERNYTIIQWYPPELLERIQVGVPGEYWEGTRSFELTNDDLRTLEPDRKRIAEFTRPQPGEWNSGTSEAEQAYRERMLALTSDRRKVSPGMAIRVEVLYRRRVRVRLVL